MKARGIINQNETKVRNLCTAPEIIKSWSAMLLPHRCWLLALYLVNVKIAFTPQILFVNSDNFESNKTNIIQERRRDHQPEQHI